MAQKKDDDERPKKPDETTNSNTSDSSMVNRVQSSATGLLRNAFVGSGANDLNADLSSSLSSTGKATSSSQSSHHPAGSSFSATDSSRLTGSAPGISRDAQHTESFRSGSTTAQEDGLEDSHLGDTRSNDLLYDLSDAKGKGKGTASEEAELASQQHPINPTTFNTAWPTNAPSEPADGSDVVALLSSPSFQPDTIPTDQEAAETHPQPDHLHDDLEQSLSPAEIDLINSFRRHPSMPSASSLHDPTPVNPLSLIPDIASAPADQQTSESHLRSLPGISDWVDLDQNYHAEVWGYLRPHIRAAMDEIEERRGAGGAGAGAGAGGEGQDAKDGPAVRRLQMILKHMRGM